MVNGLFKVRK